MKITITASNTDDLHHLPFEITELECIMCDLKELPDLSSYIHLTHLYCEYNQIQHLPNLPVKLKELWCHNNNLTELPVINSLEVLCCRNNNFTQKIDLSKYKNLKQFNNFNIKKKLKINDLDEKIKKWIKID